MKNLFTFSIVLFLFLTGCAKEKKQLNGEEKQNSNKESAQADLQGQKYFNLEGKIDNLPISMSIMSTEDYDGNSTYKGYYYYHSQEIPIFIYLDETEGNHVTMVHGGDEKSTEKFKGTLKNGVFKGTWTKGTKNLPFELKETPKTNYTEMVYLTNKKVVPVKLKSGVEVEGISTYEWYVPQDLNLQNELVKMIYPTYTDFQTYTQDALNEFEQEYKEEINDYVKNLTEEELKDFSPMTWNHTYNEYFEPLINNSNYLVMRQSGYQYTGGAHGISYQNHLTYDKRKKKWLALFDILDLDQREKITQVLDQVVRKEYNIPQEIDLNKSENSIFIVDKIYLSDDFTLSKKGITFHYGLYDLTPYVYGYFDILVPYEDLKPYLQKGFTYQAFD